MVTQWILWKQSTPPVPSQLAWTVGTPESRMFAIHGTRQLAPPQHIQCVFTLSVSFFSYKSTNLPKDTRVSLWHCTLCPSDIVSAWSWLVGVDLRHHHHTRAVCVFPSKAALYHFRWPFSSVLCVHVLHFQAIFSCLHSVLFTASISGLLGQLHFRCLVWLQTRSTWRPRKQGGNLLKRWKNLMICKRVGV